MSDDMTKCLFVFNYTEFGFPVVKELLGSSGVNEEPQVIVNINHKS